MAPIAGKYRGRLRPRGERCVVDHFELHTIKFTSPAPRRQYLPPNAKF